MAKFNIPWGPEEENRLMELRASGEGYEEIAAILNKEYKDERPFKDENGKRWKRTPEQIKWQYHNVRKRNKKVGNGDTSNVVTRPKKPRPKRHDVPTVSASPENRDEMPETGYQIIVRGQGNSLTFETQKDIKTILANITELL